MTRFFAFRVLKERFCSMIPKRRARGFRKYLRKEKARLRRLSFQPKEGEKLVRELLERLRQSS